MPSADDIINLAITQLDVHEDPIGSNSTIYGQWYGVNPAPWCAMFVSWVFAHAGLTLDMSDEPNCSANGFAGVGFGKDWFSRHQQLVTEPQRGDVVFYEWENDSWPDHVGLVESVNADGTLNTIEGNSPDPVPDYHGDEVARHVRGRNVARWFGRPNYAQQQQAPVATEPVAPFTVTDTGWVRASHPLVAQGATGIPVVHLQMLLHITADGQFGPQTHNEVVNRQMQYGLQQDGQVGPLTWAALHDLLRRGMTEPQVGELQRALGLNADNAFGPQTELTVRVWQVAKQLTVDGQVGAQTWHSLM